MITKMTMKKIRHLLVEEQPNPICELVQKMSLPAQDAHPIHHHRRRVAYGEELNVKVKDDTPRVSTRGPVLPG